MRRKLGLSCGILLRLIRLSGMVAHQMLGLRVGGGVLLGVVDRVHRVIAGQLLFRVGFLTESPGLVRIAGPIR